MQPRGQGLSRLTLLLIHLIPRPFTTELLAPASLLLIVILHIHDRLPLCLRDILTKHHDLVLRAVILLELLAQRTFDSQPDLNIILGDKADSKTTLSGTGSTSDTVDIAGRVYSTL